MAIQLSTAVRNAQIDALETSVGTAPKLRLYAGAAPANCAAAEAGTLLAELTLPSDWEAAAASGSKTLLGGPWAGAASASGTIGHFRLYDGAGTTCHMQGSVGQASGDMPFDNPAIVTGQAVSISTFTITAGNA